MVLLNVGWLGTAPLLVWSGVCMMLQLAWYFLGHSGQWTLCGAHALERVGEMKSQKIQKGWGFFYSEDKNIFLVKGVE